MCDSFFGFEKRKYEHKKILLSVIGIVMGVISAYINLYDNDTFEMGLYVVSLLILICVLYKERFWVLAIVSIWMIFVLAMIDIMISVLFDVTMKLFDINGGMISNLVISLTSLILVYCVGKIYKRNTSVGIVSMGLSNIFWYSILMIADAFVVTGITFVRIDMYVTKYRSMYLLAVVFVIIGIFIQLASVILLFTQRNVYKEKEELTDKYLNEQTLHYEYLENRERETKKFRHDLRSHMELISHLAKSREYDKIDEYIEQMHERIDTFGNVITVHNSIVDAIINQYYTRAEQSGITMEVKGRFPLDCNIDTYDLCTIFSNVLSNALEAARETEEKYIFVECGYTDKSIIIIVKNSFDVQTKNGNAQWRTRKGNTDYHGYGLENIQDSVERYNGVFDIETDDKMFTVKILFRNRK